MVNFARRLLGHAFPIVFAGRKLYREMVRPIRIGVRALVIHENKVALVRHHSQNFWVLPGGLVKRGESLRSAAVREVREETGAVVEVERLLGMYSKMHEGMTLHTAVFVCHPKTPLQARFNIEISEARFWPIDALPDSQGMVEERLAEYLAGARGVDQEF